MSLRILLPALLLCAVFGQSAEPRSPRLLSTASSATAASRALPAPRPGRPRGADSLGLLSSSADGDVNSFRTRKRRQARRGRASRWPRWRCAQRPRDAASDRPTSAGGPRANNALRRGGSRTSRRGLSDALDPGPSTRRCLGRPTSPPRSISSSASLRRRLRGPLRRDLPRADGGPAWRAATSPQAAGSRPAGRGRAAATPSTSPGTLMRLSLAALLRGPRPGVVRNAAGSGTAASTNPECCDHRIARAAAARLQPLDLGRRRR
jgi:hypothetical protein